MEYYLHSFGVPIGHYVIDFFEETAAREFVTRYVGDRSKGTVETGSQPFVRARDELLEAIKGAVTPDGGDGRLAITVLGYAPVLEAVSQYLLDEENRRNYHRLLQALKRDAREWELLLQVSEVLLDREQQKQTKQFQESLKSKAGPGWRDWSKLYSPEEQFQRLLAKRFKAQQPPLPAELPVTLRTDYERAVQVALGDHPFVGSVNGLHPLFGEYLYARLFTDDSTTTSPIAESAREMLRTETYLPTRALARFVHALTTRQGPPRVSARDFGFVYESVLSDQQKPGDVLLRLRSSGAPDELHGWMNAGGRPLDFRIIQTAQGLWFWRNLSHASGSFECPVDLGVQGGDFRLGPAVNLECSTLQCPAELRIYLGDDREGEEVVLVASSFGATARAPVVRGKRFYVRGNSVPWPWSDYRVPEPPTAQATAKIIDLYNHLTRILLWFRAAGYEEIARVDEIVENAATGGTEIARDLLRFCVEKGLIERGKLYTLNSEKLAAYEIHYNDLSLRILRDPAIKFLAEFLDWRKK